MTTQPRHGVRFASGLWLKEYSYDGSVATPKTARDPSKARRFDSKSAAEDHIKWAGWEPDEATAEPLPERTGK